MTTIVKKRETPLPGTANDNDEAGKTHGDTAPQQDAEPEEIPAADEPTHKNG